MDLDLKHKLIKGAITGGIAAGGSILLGETGPGRIFGMDVSAPVAVGLASGVGSVSADFAHQLILPYIPQSESLKNMESAALAIGVSGGVTAMALGAQGRQFWTTAALGAGSNVLGDYATYGFVLSGSGHSDSSFF